MKKGLLSSVAVTALALGVSAPAYAGSPTPYNWTGFYVGLNAGGAWGRSSANTSVDCSSALTPPAYMCNSAGVGAANAAAVNTSGTGTINASGFSGGLQAGYNWQRNNLVYGLETDFGAFSLKGSRSASGNYPVSNGQVFTTNTYNVGSSVSTNWLFTFRGRVGWAIDNWLLYTTGGLALTNLQVNNTFSDNNGIPGASAAGSRSSNKLGWTIGAGLEWALSRQWTVKGEYLYVNFGSVTANGVISNPPPGGVAGYAQGISTSSDLTAHVARLGVNYKF